MIDLTQDDGVCTLTLLRPERGNALSADMVEALLAAIEQVFNSPDIHTLVLRGAGRHFCTGMDLSDLESSSDGELLWRIVRVEALLSAIWHAPLRTVAVAQGRAWGAGADLFAACEQRVALPGSSFRFPGPQFGLVLGSRRLSERVGADAARAITIEAHLLDAAQALASGLATHSAEAPLAPEVERETARRIREATRVDHRDADLASLVRSAARPGLRDRILAYRQRLRAPAGPA